MFQQLPGGVGDVRGALAAKGDGKPGDGLVKGGVGLASVDQLCQLQEDGLVGSGFGIRFRHTGIDSAAGGRLQIPCELIKAGEEGAFSSLVHTWPLQALLACWHT